MARVTNYLFYGVALEVREPDREVWLRFDGEFAHVATITVDKAGRDSGSVNRWYVRSERPGELRSVRVGYPTRVSALREFVGRNVEALR